MKLLNQKVDLSEFFEKIHRGSLLMLDYDGTLAPLVQKRDQAYPYPGAIERVSKLMERKSNRLVIVSGRSLVDLEKLLGISEIELWGSHGLERKLPDGKMILAPINEISKNGLERGIRACQEVAEAQYCEIKPYSVALHWRGMDPEEAARIGSLVELKWNTICSEYNFELHRFDGGIELRLRGQNKGDVVEELLREVSKDIAIAYLGDDATDEDAFARLGNRGLKVLVRKQFRTTQADVHLIPPDDLLKFLDLWDAAYE